jgi:hypothetical protein
MLTVIAFDFWFDKSGIWFDLIWFDFDFAIFDWFDWTQEIRKSANISVCPPAYVKRSNQRHVQIALANKILHPQNKMRGTARLEPQTQIFNFGFSPYCNDPQAWPVLDCTAGCRRHPAGVQYSTLTSLTKWAGWATHDAHPASIECAHESPWYIG